MPITLAPESRRSASDSARNSGLTPAVPVSQTDPAFESDTHLPASPAIVREARRLTRRSAKRLAIEELLTRAKHLPPRARAMIAGHLELGMTIDELAVVHHLRPTQMRRQIKRLRQTLCDPSFLLTAEFAGQLPSDLALLARQHWIECRTFRELAAELQTTLHHVRTQLADARSLLMVAMAAQQAISPERAWSFLK